MINERQIRFLYPPFILLGSLFLGVCFDKTLSWGIIKANFGATNNLVGTIIGGGILVLVSGYIIGTITITALSVFFIRNNGIYEVNSKQKFDKIGEIILNPGGKIEDNEKLYAFVTFDHKFLPDNIHEWIQRRWSSFHTSANAVTSLVLSVFVGHALGINIWTWWLGILSALIIIYFYHACRARRETIAMINFQTKIKPLEQ